MPTFFNLKLRFAIVSTLLFLAAIWFSTKQLVDMLHVDIEALVVKENVEDTARIAESVDKAIGLRIAVLKSVAANITPDMLHRPKSLHRWLESKHDLTAMFRLGLAIVAKDGKVLAEYPPLPGRAGADFSRRKSFLGVMATGAPALGDPLHDMFIGYPIVPMGVPIRDASGEIIGALLGAVGLADDSLVSPGKAEESRVADFFVISPAQGIYVTAPADAGRALLPLSDEILAVLAKAAPTSEPRHTLAPINGKPSFVELHPLGSAPWLVLGIHPAEASLAPLRRMERGIFTSVALLTVLLAVLSWWVGYHLLSPLDRFAGSLDTMSHASTPTISAVPETGVVELRRIASSFNRLAAVIQRQTRQIEEDAERFHKVADLSPTLIRLTDKDNATRWINSTWTSITRTGSDDALGQRWLERVHPDDRELVINRQGIYHEARLPIDMEYRLLDGDGNYRWFSDRTVPVSDRSGAYAGDVSSSVDITERKNHEQEQQRLLAQNRELVASIFRVIEDERRMIARDLHDDLGQWITAIRANVSAVAHWLPGNAPTTVTQAVDAVEECASEMHLVVRKMLSELMPSHVDTLGLNDALEELVDQWQRAFPQVSCDLIIDDELPDTDHDVKTTLYRVVQESLTNVAKHASATQVSIWLRGTRAPDPGGRQVLLSIEDNGIGMLVDHESMGGLGLVGMRERIVAIGGRFELHSHPEAGTVVDVRVPTAVLAGAVAESR